MALDTGVPVAEPLPANQQKVITMPGDKWTDQYALDIVKSDWAYAEAFRTNAHDWRYRNADELYLAWQGQNYWDGTRVPRSSLGVYVVFSQVEALLPKLVRQVTSYDGYHFFNGRPLSDAEENDLTVLAWKTLVTRQLDEIDFREQVRRALKCMAVYGNGVLEVGVEEYTDEYIDFQKMTVPKATQTIFHPMVGAITVPTQTEDRFKRNIRQEKKLRPYVRYVSVKDVFMDPNCESSIPQDAGYFIKRRYMRSEQVKTLKGQTGFRIPDDDYLTSISKAKSSANADVTKLSAELFRYNYWNPSQDWSADPAQKRIAVIEYTTPDRKIWWLQGGDQDTKSIIYNQPNKYGMINYFSVSYADVLDRWHGLSISDITEGEQRLQGALINGRVDEIALALHPPALKRRGVTVPWYQLKRAPGRVTEVENPKEDIVHDEIPNVTQSSYIEVAASENRAQKTTGITDLAALGTPSGGGNSANRTAAGINTQAGATQDRVGYLVETIEDTLIEPVVQAVIKFNRKFMDLKTAANWLKMDSRFQNLDPVKVMGAPIGVQCRASVKMAARTQLLQIFPQLAQVFLNPEFVQLNAQVNNQIINPKAWAKSITDALSYTPPEPWFVDMKPEQKQQMQQPPPAEKMKAMLQMQQTQADDKQNQDRLKTKLLEVLMKELFETHRSYSELDDKHAQFLLDQANQASQDEGPNGGGGGGEGNSAGS